MEPGSRSKRGPDSGTERPVHDSQHRSLLIGTLGAGLLAFGFVGFVAVLLRNSSAQRGWPMLSVAAATTLVLFTIAVFNAGRPPLRPNDRAARVVLRALMVTINVVAATYSYIALTGNGKFSWFVIVPVPTWILCAWYAPFLVDSPVLSDQASPNGWKKLAGLRMIYSNPDDEALWMEFPGPTLGRSIQHTPNLGNRWGRVVGLVFVLMIIAMIAAMAAL